MRNKRVWSLLLALTLAAGLLTGCGAAPETAEQDDRPALVVGVDPFPPYAYIGAAGAPVGIDIELATEAFGRMGYRAEFRFIDWSAKAELLENGEIDCLWCCFSMDGRAEEYRWAGPYMTSRQVVAVMPDSDIAALSDLEGLTMAVHATTKPEELFLHPDEYGLPRLRQLISAKPGTDVSLSQQGVCRCHCLA